MSTSNKIRGSGVKGSETRPTAGFAGVELACIGTLHLAQGEGEEVRIEADDNLLPLFKTEVRGGILKISLEKGKPIRATLPVEFHVSAPTLDSVALSSPGRIEGENLHADDLMIESSGAGGVRLMGLETRQINVRIKGAGNVKVSGEAEQQTVTSSGTGDYQAEGLSSARAGVTLEGVGSATVRVSGSLEAKVSGIGSVRYLGNPSVSKKVSGLGKVIQI